MLPQQAGDCEAAVDGTGTNAWLFCGPANSPTASDEPGVPLDAAGNFKIDDVLSPVRDVSL
jgi:hypothetical protein